MKEYQEPYHILWKGIREALDEMRKLNYGKAQETLLRAQFEAEECYISWETEGEMDSTSEESPLD